MKVSELAKRARVAPSAIRLYERMGVLPAARRTESGYREYAEADLDRVRVLATLRSLGLDLSEADGLLPCAAKGAARRWPPSSSPRSRRVAER